MESVHKSRYVFDFIKWFVKNMGLLCSERGGGTENGKAHAVGVEREKAGHPPRKLEKGFRGELIYNKKASWILIKLYST